MEHLKLRPRLFLATKVSISGREAGERQIEQSFKRLRTSKIDLIAVHNLRDTQAHLATLRELKKTGAARVCRGQLGAARGRLPDAAMRRRMESFIDAV
ncbi:MAG: hypothetical protein ACREUN_14670 [Burkholderiales bacterium]